MPPNDLRFCCGACQSRRRPSSTYYAAAEGLTLRQQQARVRRRAALRLEVQRPPQLTAFFTRAPILASSMAVNSFSAKSTGHTVPSSSFALSLKPNVAYLALNLCALWKKQTTLPLLAYAGIPYQVLGERAGALALIMAWMRSAMARSGFGISAIFASTSLSPSAFSARGPRRASAFSSWARSFIAARSSSVNPLTPLPVTVALLVDFCVSIFGLIEPPHTDFGWTPRAVRMRIRAILTCAA